jgi:hypothetical protein
MALDRDDSVRQHRPRVPGRLLSGCVGLAAGLLVLVVLEDMMMGGLTARVTNASEAVLRNVRIGDSPIAPKMDSTSAMAAELLVRAPTHVSLTYQDNDGVKYSCYLNLYVDQGSRGRMSVAIKEGMANSSAILWSTPLALLLGGAWPQPASIERCVPENSVNPQPP